MRTDKRACQVCRHPTRSLTRLCANHRPPDAAPRVAVDGKVINVAGIALTAEQAVCLADALVDAAEQIQT